MRERIQVVFVYIFIVGFISITAIDARPYSGDIKEFEQPDGTIIQLKLFGDEYYVRAETKDGYTVVRDEETEWICYARLNHDSTELISTGIKVLPDSADENETSIKGSQYNLPDTSVNYKRDKHIKLKNDAIRKRVGIKRDKLESDSTDDTSSEVDDSGTDSSEYKRLNLMPAPGDPYPSTEKDFSYFEGTVIGLMVVVDFPDEPITDYYSSEQEAIEYIETSTNSLDPEEGSLRHHFQTYSGEKLDLQYIIKGVFRAPETYEYYDNLSYGEGHNRLLEMALNQLESEGFDFSQLSTENNSNEIRALTIATTGDAQTWAEGMWLHMGWTDFNFEADGVSTDRMCCCSEDAGGLIHEHGHLVGEWPDTYSYNADETPCWGVMGGGHTDLPNPWFLFQNGWLDADNIAEMSNGTRLISDGTDPNKGYLYYLERKPDEFFFIKNYNTELPFSSWLSDEGITVWRIDKTGDNTDYPNTDLRVELLHASNDINNNDDYVCFKESYKSEFNDGTVPSSKWRDSSSSGLGITEISGVGPEMSFIVGSDLFFISSASNTGGSIYPSGMVGVEADSSLTLRITPDRGYRIDSLFVDGVSRAADSLLTLENIDQNLNITAVFEPIDVFAGEGEFYIKNSYGMFLGIDSEEASDGASVVQKDSADAGTWLFQQNSDSSYVLNYNGSGYCLDIYGASIDPGADAVIWTGHGDDNQSYTIIGEGDGEYYIRPKHSGLVLQTGNDASDTDASVIQGEYNSDFGSQIFTIVSPSEGNENPELSLDAAGDVQEFYIQGEGIDLVSYASDPDGEIEYVSLYKGNELIGTESDSPYEWGASDSDSYMSLPDTGNIAFIAEAQDNSGAFSYDTLEIKVVSTLTLPGTIDAEKFASDSGVETYTEDQDVYIGDIEYGDWAEYAVEISSSGNYMVMLNSATNTSGAEVLMEFKGDAIGSFEFSGSESGSLNDWYQDTLLTEITAGTGVLRLNFTGDAGYQFSIKNIEFIRDYTNVASFSGYKERESSPTAGIVPNPVHSGNEKVKLVLKEEVTGSVYYRIYDASGNTVTAGQAERQAEKEYEETGDCSFFEIDLVMDNGMYPANGTYMLFASYSYMGEMRTMKQYIAIK